MLTLLRATFVHKNDKEVKMSDEEEKKKKKNIYYWYARFYFSQKAENGKLEVLFK